MKPETFKDMVFRNEGEQFDVKASFPDLSDTGAFVKGVNQRGQSITSSLLGSQIIQSLNVWLESYGLTPLITGMNDSYPGNVYVMAHSMGNVVTGEALRLAGGSEIVNTYVASQGAVSARAYDNTIPPDATNLYLGPVGTPDTEGHYYTNGAPPYFNGISGAQQFVDYYNNQDWVLGQWVNDQNGKPDLGYIWTIPSTNYPSGYYYHVGFGSPRALYFGTNTYEIFAKAVQSYSLTLGAETNIAIPFNPLLSVDLNSAPYSFGDHYVGHSAQFSSDIMTRSFYWNQLLQTFNLKPQSSQ